MNYKVEQVKDMLGSIEHGLSGWQWALSLLKENEDVTEELLLEMQKTINVEFQRLRLGLEPIVSINHLKTRCTK